MEIQVSTRNTGEAAVTLIGGMNEEADVKLKLLIEEVRQFPKLEFVFDKVAGINSLGIRAWVTFLRSIRAQHQQIVFSGCTPEIISQVNMIPSFAEGVFIKSFYVNYICPACDGTLTQLVQRSNLTPHELPASVTCPNCKSADLETEELEDEYFAFLSQTSAS